LNSRVFALNSFLGFPVAYGLLPVAFLSVFSGFSPRSSLVVSFTFVIPSREARNLLYFCHSEPRGEESAAGFSFSHPKRFSPCLRASVVD
jgi:hypothetical protein